MHRSTALFPVRIKKNEKVCFLISTSGSFKILDDPCLNAIVEAGVPDTDQVRGWAPGGPGSVLSVEDNLSDQLPVRAEDVKNVSTLSPLDNEAVGQVSVVEDSLWACGPWLGVSDELDPRGG